MIWCLRVAEAALYVKEKIKLKANVIEKIFDSDALIIGSPIYFGQPTSEFRALVERLIFCIMSYDDGSSYYTGKVNVGIFYTMNAPLEFYEQSMKDSLSSTEFLFSFLNGEVISYPVCDTLQVHKYYGRFFTGSKRKATYFTVSK